MKRLASAPGEAAAERAPDATTECRSPLIRSVRLAGQEDDKNCTSDGRIRFKEVPRHQIRLNPLGVTSVEDTPTWDRFSDGDMTEQRQRMFSKITAKASFGIAHASDVGNVAAFLVSGDARFITGATISATGGLT